MSTMSQRAHIRLRRKQIDKYMRLAGITKQAQLAEKMGVAEASVCRTLNGRTAPGEKFIAGLLAAFLDGNGRPTVTFDDIFEVVVE